MWKKGLAAALCAAFLMEMTAWGYVHPFAGAHVGAADTAAESVRQVGKTPIGSVCWTEGKTVSEIPMYRANADIIYNGQKIDSEATPVMHARGVDLVPIEPLLCEKGPKASMEENRLTGHVRLVWQNHLVTFYVGEDKLYSSGWKKKLDAPVMSAKYGTKNGRECYAAPLTQLCEALGLTCSWDEKKQAYILTGKKVSFSGEETKTSYAYSRKDFTWKEYKQTRQEAYRVYEKMINPENDTTHGFQFLRVDEYREVDWENFEQYYQYLIEDYCRENKMKPEKSVLYGKADVIRKAAEQYDLDPVYFVNQTFLESGYGTSTLAQGKVISRVAYRNFAQWGRGGRLKTKQLKKKVKVYNLYGIKAIDADPVVGGTSYAYYAGWTTPDKAIYGAAEYISENYIHGSFHQNTVYKMRYSFRKNIWHQYAYDPRYAQKIGERIYLMSSCYGEDADFLYDYPSFKK